MAGHSKWTQIKHKKAVSDAKRGALFSKISQEIAIAIQNGGPNPDANPRLQRTIERARSLGFPKENVERTLQRIKDRGGNRALSEFLYEATGSGGVMLIIEGTTDNKNRAFAEIRNVLSDAGVKIADPGSVIWNFNRVGVIDLPLPPPLPISTEELEEIIINAGAKDYLIQKERMRIETDPKYFDAVLEAIKKSGILVVSSSIVYKPKRPISLDAPQRAAIEKTIEKLFNRDDVKDVSHNISLTEGGKNP
jgi:YebC/PmpR family DNA-binding regulatory protein